MSRRGIALWGILAVLVVLVGAALWEAPRIEHGLTVHAERALADRGISGVQVRFDGRDAVLSGPGVTDLAVAVVADQAGVRRVRVDRSGQRPVASLGPAPSTALPSGSDAGTGKLPASQVAQRIVELLGPAGLRFPPGSADLPADRQAVLGQIAALLAANPTVRLEVDGYTDLPPPGGTAQALSRSRAAAVADYLTARGVSASMLTVAGYGDTRPVADNSTDAGRAANRRVEITVLGG
ncbi:MAG: OmpA-OmpF porin, family [Mycobacteriales bacterium]|jgi:outer membrane protein OmpA-like peptidoglycan-associated protein